MDSVDLLYTNSTIGRYIIVAWYSQTGYQVYSDTYTSPFKVSEIIVLHLIQPSTKVPKQQT